MVNIKILSVLFQLRQQNAANQSSSSQASGVGPPGKGAEPKHEPQY